MEKIELEVYGFDILQEYFRVKGEGEQKKANYVARNHSAST